jgi:hypothetical protein
LRQKEKLLSNLGGYQKIVEVVKTLGGPKKATVIVVSGAAVAGYTGLRGAEAAVKKGISASRAALEKRKTPCPAKGQFFRVTSDGEAGAELTLKAGDGYRVLEGDKDAILIEVLGASDNPHVVSGSFLATISDFQPPTRSG